ncbi:MAG: RnfABCDGE type electron transport complex subunit D [bacterium]
MAKKGSIELPEQYQVRLTMSASPHIRAADDVPRIMRDVVTALAPAALGALYFFRLDALLVMLTCIVTAVITEYVCAKWIFGRRVTIDDWSAVIAGLLLAFCLPPGIPLWAAAIGSACAIFFGKMIFGGLGQNIFNPALVGRAILLASWPVSMTMWQSPVDGVSAATPLGIIKEGLEGVVPPSFFDLLVGNVAGSLGETSALLLLIGAAYLLYRGIISWHVPIPFIAVVVIGSLFTGRDPLYELLAGGLILGAFFMATDMVTSPLSRNGRVIFGFGCGLLTFLIRNFGGYPEGVCYAILIMNSTVPIIDRYTAQREFGTKGRSKK